MFGESGATAGKAFSNVYMQEQSAPLRDDGWIRRRNRLPDTAMTVPLPLTRRDDPSEEAAELVADRFWR